MKKEFNFLTNEKEINEALDAVVNKEFKLSDKKKDANEVPSCTGGWTRAYIENYFLEKDVKEFIRRLKKYGERIGLTKEDFDYINKLAGEELI